MIEVCMMICWGAGCPENQLQVQSLKENVLMISLPPTSVTTNEQH